MQNQERQQYLSVGYTVTKRIRKAVQRNKIKRQMREAFRLNKECYLQKILNQTAFDLVFMYTGNAEKTNENSRFSLINQAVLALGSLIQCGKQLE